MSRFTRTRAKRLAEVLGDDNVYVGSIFDYPVKAKADLALIKGVLIHINPDMLNVVYDKLYEASSKYILVCEYYNPAPVSIPYRGHDDRLFKRDFAGEILERFSDLSLVDYGFAYRRGSGLSPGRRHLVFDAEGGSIIIC